MPSLKKAVLWVIVYSLLALGGPALSIFALIAIDAWLGLSLFVAGGGAGVLGWTKVWGAIADLKVERYKIVGLKDVDQKRQLKTLNKHRKQWRTALMQAKTSDEREHAFRGLIGTEQKLAKLKDIAYDIPEHMRGR
jgi:hypothetical protein